VSTEDPRCPECGEPIGQRATYCMHCSADLTDEQEAADTDDDGDWDRDSDVADERAAEENDPISSVVDDAAEEISGGSEATTAADGSAETAAAGGSADPTASQPAESPARSGEPTPQGTPASGDDELLDSDGIVDNTLTVIVGIAAGIVVGIVATITVLSTIQTGWGFLLGLLAWIASTAHLVRRDTVQGAVSRGAYAVAIVLLLTALIPLSPLVSVEGGLAGRAEAFVATLLLMAFPAGFAAAVGWIAGRFVPE
jgi:hypothetical protein